MSANGRVTLGAALNEGLRPAQIQDALAQAIADSFFAMEAGESWDAGGYSRPKIASGDQQLAFDIMKGFEVYPRESTA